MLKARVAAILLSAWTPGAAWAGGSVAVHFAAAESLGDRDFEPYRRAGVVRELDRHLHRLAARHLADGRTLRIDVLDLDLAGRSA